MKINKTVKIIFIILVLSIVSLIFINTNTYCATQIVATNSFSTKNLEDSYKCSRDLGLPTSTLGDNALEPHLSTAREWGAVAFLGISIYGDVTANYGSATTVSLNGSNHSSTTGNASGVIDLGISSSNATTTQSTHIASYTSDTTSGNLATVQSIFNNSKYVDYLRASTGEPGTTFGEIKNWYGSTTSFLEGSYFIPYINGINSMSRSNGSSLSTDRKAWRPVIWN